MANKNSKIVGRIGGTDNMVRQALEDMKEVRSAIEEELDFKQSVLEDLLKAAAEAVSRPGGNTRLAFSEDEGLAAFMYTSLDQLLDEDAYMPVFSGIGDGGWEYRILVHVVPEPGVEGAASAEISVIRMKGGKAEALTDDGWQEAEVEINE